VDGPGVHAPRGAPGISLVAEMLRGETGLERVTASRFFGWQARLGELPSLDYDNDGWASILSLRAKSSNGGELRPASKIWAARAGADVTKDVRLECAQIESTAERSRLRISTENGDADLVVTQTGAARRLFCAMRAATKKQTG